MQTLYGTATGRVSTYPATVTTTPTTTIPTTSRIATPFISSAERKKNVFLDLLKSGTLSRQRGMYNVPHDMPAILHRGETVTPAGRTKQEQ